MRIIRSSLIVAVVLILAAVCCGSFAYCSGLAEVSLEGEYVLEGGPDRLQPADFILESIGDSPMPKDSVGGAKKVSALPGEKFSFGEICYSGPGVYEYIVRRPEADNIKSSKDMSVFKVYVDVFSDGSAVSVYEKEGDEGKSDKMVFTDRYELPERTDGTGKPVKTGDGTSYGIYMVLIIAALICLIECRFLLSDE